MGRLLLVGLAGFMAWLVDGALGMGFGPTASSILLGSGLSPAATSTTVNLAKVVTGLASGVSHWRFGNVDRSLVLRLAIPGMVGALIGVTVLANVDGDALRPILAALLMLVAIRILVRFGRLKPVSAATGHGRRRGPQVRAPPRVEQPGDGHRRRGGRRHQRHDRRLGPGGDAVPAPPGPAATLRHRLGEHRRGRGGRRRLRLAAGEAGQLRPRHRGRPGHAHRRRPGRAPRGLRHPLPARSWPRRGRGRAAHGDQPAASCPPGPVSARSAGSPTEPSSSSAWPSA